MKVLVTGATGFIGRYVVAKLLERGYAVTLLEQSRLASAASGENTGTLLQQTEPVVAAMLRETVAITASSPKAPSTLG